MRRRRHPSTFAAAAGLYAGACLLAPPATAEIDLFQDCSYRLLSYNLLYVDRRDRDNAILLDEVVRLCTRYIARNPDDKLLLSRAYEARGDAFRGGSDFARALEDYDKSIELDPENAGAYAKRGAVLLDWQQFGRAIDDLTIAIVLGAADGHVHARRGQAHLATGDYPRAIADLTKSIETDDPPSAIRFRLTDRASAHLHAGKPESAIADATRAIELYPNAPDLTPHFIRASAYEMTGDRERAIAEYKAMHELIPWLFDRASLAKHVERLGGKP